MNKFEKAVKEVRELREYDEECYREKQKKRNKDNVGMFWSRDGMRFYIVLIGEILEFSLPIPFSYDFRKAVYIGKQELIKGDD